MTRLFFLFLLALCLQPIAAQACSIQVVQPYFTVKSESDARKIDIWIKRNSFKITRTEPEGLRYNIGTKISVSDAGAIQQAGIKNHKIYGVALPTDAKVTKWGGVGSCE